jgi:hypothetical protein
VDAAGAPTLVTLCNLQAGRPAYDGTVGKGYAEGPAAEERFADLERAERGEIADTSPDRQAVYGSTDDDTERHFLGWLGDVDPDDLFASGQAWGITVVRQRDA